MSTNIAPYLRQRHKRLKQALKKQNISCLLVSTPSNITYLTGVHPLEHSQREAFIVASSFKLILFVSPLRYQHFTHLSKFFTIKQLNQKNLISGTINKLISSKNYLTTEPKDLHVSEFQKLKKNLKIKISTKELNFVETLRIVKDDYEIEQIKKACQITKQTWARVKLQIKPGKTEQEIAHLIISTLKSLGADGIPQGFNPIVAAGPNSAIPHHASTIKKIKPRDVVLVDFGCTVNGYCSDFTRTITVGEPSKKFLEIESIVKQAYRSSLNSLPRRPASPNLGEQAGLAKSPQPSQIDKAARQTIAKAGYGGYFIHTTGHGLGLDIHEPPTISSNSIAKKIKSGTTITIEPGIYLPGKFGVRHENTILISDSGYKSLTE